MKLILTPRRHAVPLKPGERRATPEEKSAQIAEGRRKMTQTLMRRFPQAKILGIEGADRIIVDLPDSELDLPARIRESLDVVSGPVPGDGPPMPVWRADLPPTLETVEAMYGERLYRPTVVAIVRDDYGRILFVQAARNAEWGVVQGGIEERESPSVALFRELKEEISAGARRVRRRPPVFVGCIDIDAEPGAADHLRFTKGVRYFIYDVAYHGPERLVLKKDELSAYEWVPPILGDPRMLALLSGTRPAKQALIIGSLVRILA